MFAFITQFEENKMWQKKIFVIDFNWHRFAGLYAFLTRFPTHFDAYGPGMGPFSHQEITRGEVPVISIELTIIPGARVGNEMIDRQRRA